MIHELDNRTPFEQELKQVITKVIIKLSKALAPIAYQLKGYPLGKSKRGYKKWLKKLSK